MPSPAGPRLGATFAITAGALFMFALDRLIVVTALPAIQRDLGASLQALEWTVSAYTLTFTVLLLAGAALGDRFGRRRMFTAGLALFTAGSAAAALAPTAGALVMARALQGVGGSLIAPLSLTILSAAAPAGRRGAVLGAWGAVAAAAAAIGPVAGGALAAALSWHWIFWINVPVGLALIPLARRGLDESHGPHSELDLPGIALSGTALLMIVWGLVEAGRSSWSSPVVLSTLLAGAVGLVAFVAWERRAPAPMLPMRFFRRRGFAAGSAAALLGYLGMLGALFEIGQLMQTGLGATPLGAGLRLLPMTTAMMVTAPVAGALSDRLGPRPLLVGALALEALALAWLGQWPRPASPSVGGDRAHPDRLRRRLRVRAAPGRAAGRRGPRRAGPGRRRRHRRARARRRARRRRPRRRLRRPRRWAVARRVRGRLRPRAARRRRRGGRGGGGGPRRAPQPARPRHRPARARARAPACLTL